MTGGAMRAIDLVPAAVLVRPCRADEVEQVADLLRRSWLTSFAPLVGPEGVRRFREINLAGAYAKAMWRDFTLAASENTIFAMLHVQDDLIAAIHVDPPVKGLGIGSLLMSTAEASIFGHSETARLEVLQANSAAIGFYAQRGWKECHRFEGEECSVPMVFLELQKKRPKQWAPLVYTQ
jgi:GNAT superfamily N-acetyltransferase